MNRQQLEHVVRAAAEISGEREIVVVGSQAILACGREIPPAMLRSMEADVYPLNHPERADVIDGAIGAGSIFEESFGYHADGVGPATAKLPDGWWDRALRFTPANSHAVAICPEPNDLAVAKLVSGRDKDLDWVRVGVRAGLFEIETLRGRLPDAPAGEAVLAQAQQRLAAMADA